MIYGDRNIIENTPKRPKFDEEMRRKRENELEGYNSGRVSGRHFLPTALTTPSQEDELSVEFHTKTSVYNWLCIVSYIEEDYGLEGTRAR